MKNRKFEKYTNTYGETNTYGDSINQKIRWVSYEAWHKLLYRGHDRRRTIIEYGIIVPVYKRLWGLGYEK